jgi:hypothetical protein
MAALGMASCINTSSTTPKFEQDWVFLVERDLVD